MLRRIYSDSGPPCSHAVGIISAILCGDSSIDIPSNQITRYRKRQEAGAVRNNQTFLKYSCNNYIYM